MQLVVVVTYATFKISKKKTYATFTPLNSS